MREPHDPEASAHQDIVTQDSSEQNGSVQNGSEQDLVTGMGPTTSGPSFRPWQFAVAETPDRSRPYPTLHDPTLRGHRPTLVPSAATYAPPVSRLPALVTATVVVAVAAVVAFATLQGVRNDATITTPAPAPALGGWTAPPLPQLIEFATSEGSGRLVVLGHSWLRHSSKVAGLAPQSSRSFLRVEVELTCVDGFLEYGPYFFQAFDITGQLFNSVESAAPKPALEIGTLTSKEKVRGFVAFDMPRGDVTLLMSDAAAASVVALKISD